MKADRLLSVLLLLQAKGRATERELSERLEVSQRTIHRDLEALSAANVPVLALRGSQGGWELAEGWRTQVPGLDAAELRALLMAQPRALSHPGLRAAAESALNKLMASLPGSMREEAAAMRERLHVDPSGWWDAGEDVSALPLVQDAVTRERKLTFDYVRADGEPGPRTVDPLGLVAKGSTWYLVARTAKGMRTFRLSRMSAVTVLANEFKRPAKFNLAEHWKRSTSELEQKRSSYPVVLAVRKGATQKLTGWLAAKPVEVSELAAAGNEWVAMRMEFEHLEQARFVVMGLGTRVRVLKPVELRGAIEDEIRGVLSQMSEEAVASRP
jgi:predicted DNA-binding transcriptional regulator YafY